MVADCDEKMQVSSLELLSEVIIETLKEFSARRLALTPTSLSDALSSKGEFSRLLPPLAFDVTCGNKSPQAEPAAAPLEVIETNGSSESRSHFPQVRDTYLNILAELGPLSRGESVQRSSEMQQRIQDCKMMETLVSLGDDLISVIGLLVNCALKEMDYAGDFLAELGKDLSGMEEQLLSYRNHNRETYLSNDNFCSHLLSDTEAIGQAFVSHKTFENTRTFIASKLKAIKIAIEMKREKDKTRLQDANQKIADLQMCLQSHKEEILRTRERADALEQEVLLDGLTEIHNRRAYGLRIREDVNRYHRDGQIFSLLLMDIDHFKRINDSFGHRVGDRCLRGVAKTIRSCVRSTDFLARYGGEEFIAILAGSSAENALRIAEKIRNLIEKTKFYYQDGDREIPVTISIGVTEVRPTDAEPAAPFMRVDNAMYRAKKEGRNRVCMI